MIKRFNKIAIELPKPGYSDANAAAAMQELLGGKFGEMSTLNNYMFQSFNFRGKKKLKPFFDLIASITAEEFGHVEIVSTGIDLTLTPSSFTADPDAAPLQPGVDKRNSQHFISHAQTALVADSMGNPWRGDYVVNTGNLVFDLLHNFYLECGARTNKMRVYEMTSHPVVREVVGYLLVRGGTHIVAYAKALEMATGADVTKMLPIPDLSNDAFETSRKFQHLSNKLYTWSDQDYEDIRYIWKGQHPETKQPLEVITGMPEGAPNIDLEEMPEEFAPGVSKGDFLEIAKRLQRSAGINPS
ncbi:manganese catalase family protein [Paenibacillus gansuensis]|uniref:Manganese catalase family protein n=1 Tax=Paenibacillus gansuensis TaxID=306542 RepID=A0ABW5PHN3_9BACL